MLNYQLTTKTFVVLLVLNVAVANVEETEKNCAFDETCMKKDECSSFLEKHTYLLGLKNRGSLQFKSLRTELTDAVCNKRKKAVCCPKCEPNNNCIDRNTCEYADEKIKMYRELKSQNKGEKANEIIEELRGRVCEEKKRFMCCPNQSPDSKHLPRLGSCGVSTSQPSSIVGGEDTRPGDFPFTALLGFVVHKTSGQTRGKPSRTRDVTRWSCAGTLINRWHVVTAAHCQGRTPERMISKVRLGEWEVQGYGGRKNKVELPPLQEFDITEDDVTIHEEYQTVYENNHKNVVNDIALIKLPRPATINDGVQMACLPVYPQEFKSYLGISNMISGIVGREPSVVGWGKTNAYQLVDWDGVGSKKQQYLQIPVLSKEQCQVKNGKFTPRETQMCAGGNRGEDSCKGDSGGGVYIQESEKEKNTPWYLIGIVSFGSKECGNGRAGVYTRVSEFIPWIEKNLK